MSRRTRAKLAVAAVVAATAVTLGALQGASADAGTDTGSGGAGVCVAAQAVGSRVQQDPGSAALFRVVDRVEKIATARYSAVFTGLALDQKHQAVDVYRIPSTAARPSHFDADVCRAAEGDVTLRLHDTAVNATYLNDLTDRISADMHRWDGTFELREVGPDVHGFVRVGVDDPAKAGPILKKAFGDAHLKVEYADQAEAVTG